MFVIKLNEACKAQHEAVLAKGFEHQPIATNLMLIVSELSEAMEADRHNRYANIEAFEKETPDVIHFCRRRGFVPEAGRTFDGQRICERHVQTRIRKAHQRHVRRRNRGRILATYGFVWRIWH